METGSVYLKTSKTHLTSVQLNSGANSTWLKGTAAGTTERIQHCYSQAVGGNAALTRTRNRDQSLNHRQLGAAQSVQTVTDRNIRASLSCKHWRRSSVSLFLVYEAFN